MRLIYRKQQKNECKKEIESFEKRTFEAGWKKIVIDIQSLYKFCFFQDL